MHWIVDNKAEALEFHISSSFRRANVPLMDLRLKNGILLACISRGGKIILPRGADVLLPGDSVIVVTTMRGLNDIDDIFKDY